MKSINNKKAISAQLLFSYKGLTDYAEAYQAQLACIEQARLNNQYTILGYEHPAVLTLGHRADIDTEVFKTNQINVEKIGRGGLATIHSVGQLVIYPILNIREMQIGARKYVQLLLRTTQKTYEKLGIKTFQDEEAVGLYTENGKIAFCGVQIQHGCTLHGLSLNISNDLNLFNHIRSCGLNHPKLDKIENYQIAITLQTVFQIWSEEFLNQISE